MNIARLLDFAAEQLVHEPVARLEAEVLLCHVLSTKRSFLYANPLADVAGNAREAFVHLIQERRRGIPIAYLTGRRAFWTLDLQVTPDVLIPRPETELLVEIALQLLPQKTAQRVADLGTGSGAIALSVAKERPHWEVHATDISEAAVRVARNNATSHGLEQVRFHTGCWADPLRGKFNLMVSNPPYIPEGDPHLQQGDCRHEPALALSPGTNGTTAFTEISTSTLSLLEGGGWLLFEHGYDQGAAVRQILLEAGYEAVRTERDLAGHERASLGRAPGKPVRKEISKG